MDFVITDAEIHMVNVLDNLSDKSKEKLITIINEHTNSTEKYYCSKTLLYGLQVMINV